MEKEIKELEDIENKTYYLLALTHKKIGILINWAKKNKEVREELKYYSLHLEKEHRILRVMWENGDIHNKIFVYNCLLKMLLELNGVIDYLKKKYNLKINE